MPIRRWIFHTARSTPNAVERLLPGEDVLVDAVDQGSVEVEQEGGLREARGVGHDLAT